MLSHLLIYFAFFWTVTSALPGLYRRGLPGAVYTCTSTNFQGNCQWNAPTTECRQPGPGNLGLQSIGPDPGTTCTLYAMFDCTSPIGQHIRFPGVSHDIPTIQAFRCLPNEAQDLKTLNIEANAMAPNTKGVHGSAEMVQPGADPELAGGMGSLERKKHLAEIKAMEKDRFKDGLIGLKKGIYY